MSTVLLQYNLKSKENYRLDEPIIIDFTLENVSDHDLWVLSWYTPLEGLKGNIFEVRCDGKPIQYKGIMVKRGAPLREDYTYIPSKGSVSVTFDLSKAYEFAQCGECEVKFKGQIYDFSNRNDDIIQKETTRHNSVNIPGNAVSFRISDSK